MLLNSENPRIFKSFTGEPYTVKLLKHDISKYKYLYHVSLKERRKSIEKSGLLINQPIWKSLVSSGFLHFSYPIDENTSDCFRWYDDFCCLIVVDAQQLHTDGFIFYDDFWAANDASSQGNHIMTEQNIDPKYIKKIFEF